MASKLFSPRSWSLRARVGVPLLFVLFVLVIVIGLNSVTGLALGLVWVTIIVLAITRRWRRIRSFLFLAAGTFLGAIVLSGLYMEVAMPLAIRIGGILLVGAGAVIVGVGGAIVLAVSRAWTELHRPSTP